MEGSVQRLVSTRYLLYILMTNVFVVGVHVPVAPGLAFVSTAFGDEQGTGQPSYA